MKKTEERYKIIHRRATLSQTISTEDWLQKMGNEGYALVEVSGNAYRFLHRVPQSSRYFVMTPESGNNSDVWVFHEFEQQLGRRIPCVGSTLFSPSHILVVTQDAMRNQAELVSYYYRYRNYRLLGRFRRNALFSAAFFSLGLLVSILRMPWHAVVLFPYLLISGFLFLHSCYSYFSFHKDCVSLGYSKPAQKPRRPGY